MNKNNKIKIIGLRQGEKIHEKMVSSSDSFNTLETKKFYIILQMIILEFINITKQTMELKSQRRF